MRAFRVLDGMCACATTGLLLTLVAFPGCAVGSSDGANKSLVLTSGSGGQMCTTTPGYVGCDTSKYVPCSGGATPSPSSDFCACFSTHPFCKSGSQCGSTTGPCSSDPPNCSNGSDGVMHCKTDPQKSGADGTFVQPMMFSRHHRVPLASRGSTSIPFTWHDVAGLEAPADLWVGVGDRPLLQVSSMGGAPFAHAGLEVVPLRAGEAYRLVLARTAGGVRVTLASTSNDRVLEARIALSDPQDAAVDVVLPPDLMRSSIDVDLR